jgi:hypothetical protein
MKIYLRCNILPAVGVKRQKPANMRGNRTIRIALLMTAMMIGCFFLFRSASATGKSNSGTESMEECCKKKENGKEAGRTWQNLSRQFSSSI